MSSVNLWMMQFSLVPGGNWEDIGEERERGRKRIECRW